MSTSPATLVSTGARLSCGNRRLDLSNPLVMGILNVTPDSFSDGGKFLSVASAVARAVEMGRDGAAIIDVGGESTRPGAAPVETQQQLDRVIPVIEALAKELPVVLSVDTSDPEVMREAVAAGAGMINDVRALSAAGAMETVAATDAAVCLMHMQGRPSDMQQAPHYDDVLAEVKAFLRQRVSDCVDCGIAVDRLVLDPGFGFGKTLEHNLLLLGNLDSLKAEGIPLLVGVSRKSMIGMLLDAPVDGRLFGSLAAAVLAVTQGASIVRTHDVKPTVEALAVAAAAMSTRPASRGG